MLGRKHPFPDSKVHIYSLGFLYISSSGSANAQLPGCFHPWTFSLNIGLNMFPMDSFMSCLLSQVTHGCPQASTKQLHMGIGASHPSS